MARSRYFTPTDGRKAFFQMEPLSGYQGIIFRTYMQYILTEYLKKIRLVLNCLFDLLLFALILFLQTW